ncbi:hypothetical protein HBO38_12040 [Pseudomonas veronii]|uniref:Uncharacterized protein n=1 Tax=Pseudomonas veronii TaxID=76761 RepID=A0A7Y1A4R2_PSEVE|nr:hypothetical protein [Pseudomonas veronii]NMY09164.1 hypothetical protein [Pseudomonas veronii]
MDGLTKLLLAKYNPGKLQELLQEPVVATKSESSLSRVPDIKVAPEALEKATGMTVVMSASNYGESIIFAAVTEFNRAHPEYMSNSFTLPTITNGIPAGSWVLTNIEDLQ